LKFTIFSIYIESYVLINWLDESDPLLYDVVPSTTIVPPDKMSVLDVVPGTICHAQYDSEYYRAKVIKSRKFYMYSCTLHTDPTIM